MIYHEYKLKADFICIGERNKGGLYKPTAEILRYSMLVGALKKMYGDYPFHAFGSLLSFEKNYLTYNLRDRYSESAKIPLGIEVLHNVDGKVYITCEDNTIDLKQNIVLKLGAKLSLGFGECFLEYLNSKPLDPLKFRVGTLNSRIPIRAQSDQELESFLNGKPTQFLKQIFGIKNILKPVYGYLFKPVNQYTGYYELSLFENSKIMGSDFLIN